MQEGKPTGRAGDARGGMLRRPFVVSLAITALLILIVGGVTVYQFAWFISGPPDPEFNVDASELKRECRLLVERVRERDPDLSTMLYIDDDIPTTIASLSPRVVSFHDGQDATVCEIQVRSGFYHYGYLVVVESETEDYVPGHAFRVTKIADGVYRYKE